MADANSTTTTQEPTMAHAKSPTALMRKHFISVSVKIIVLKHRFESSRPADKDVVNPGLVEAYGAGGHALLEHPAIRDFPGPLSFAHFAKMVVAEFLLNNNTIDLLERGDRFDGLTERLVKDFMDARRRKFSMLAGVEDRYAV